MTPKIPSALTRGFLQHSQSTCSVYDVDYIFYGLEKLSKTQPMKQEGNEWYKGEHKKGK